MNYIYAIHDDDIVNCYLDTIFDEGIRLGNLNQILDLIDEFILLSELIHK